MSLTTTTPAVTTETELTAELAEILAAVLNGTLLEDGPADPADDALTAHDRYRAETKTARQTAALSVLRQLGYVHPTHDGGWFLEHAGREALAAREAAKEAARVQAVRASYAAVVAELHNLADAIDGVPVDDLAELTVELRIATAYRRAETDAVKVATVDAVALAVLGKRGETARLGSSDTWQRKAEARRGEVKVEVFTFVEDPTARLRALAEQERESEVERLRAELAEMKAERERAVQALADSI